MFTDPIKNLKAFGLKEDNIVADLGAGTGFYSVVAGKMAPKGKVYAVEIDKDFLATVKHKAKEAHLNNVEVLWGNIEKKGGTHIGDNIVDAVIASNILFQIQDKDKFILEIKRILKPRGRVLLVDYFDNSFILGSKLSVPKSRAKEMFEKRGFTLERDINAGMHHYGMILIKS